MRANALASMRRIQLLVLAPIYLAVFTCQPGVSGQDYDEIESAKPYAPDTPTVNLNYEHILNSSVSELSIRKKIENILDKVSGSEETHKKLTKLYEKVQVHYEEHGGRGRASSRRNTERKKGLHRLFLPWLLLPCRCPPCRDTSETPIKCPRRSLGSKDRCISEPVCSSPCKLIKGSSDKKPPVDCPFGKDSDGTCKEKTDPGPGPKPPSPKPRPTLPPRPPGPKPTKPIDPPGPGPDPPPTPPPRPPVPKPTKPNDQPGPQPPGPGPDPPPTPPPSPPGPKPTRPNDPPGPGPDPPPTKPPGPPSPKPTKPNDQPGPEPDPPPTKPPIPPGPKPTRPNDPPGPAPNPPPTTPPNPPGPKPTKPNDQPGPEPNPPPTTPPSPPGPKPTRPNDQPDPPSTPPPVPPSLKPTRPNDPLGPVPNPPPTPPPISPRPKPTKPSDYPEDERDPDDYVDPDKPEPTSTPKPTPGPSEELECNKAKDCEDCPEDYILRWDNTCSRCGSVKTDQRINGTCINCNGTLVPESIIDGVILDEEYCEPDGKNNGPSRRGRKKPRSRSRHGHGGGSRFRRWARGRLSRPRSGDSMDGLKRFDKILKDSVKDEQEREQVKDIFDSIPNDIPEIRGDVVDVLQHFEGKNNKGGSSDGAKENKFESMPMGDAVKSIIARVITSSKHKGVQRILVPCRCRACDISDTSTTCEGICVDNPGCPVFTCRKDG